MIKLKQEHDFMRKVLILLKNELLEFNLDPTIKTLSWKSQKNERPSSK